MPEIHAMNGVAIEKYPNIKSNFLSNFFKPLNLKPLTSDQT